MKINPSNNLINLSKEELQAKYFDIIRFLNDKWINPDLHKLHWKDREKKCAKHSLELTELDVICKMLERENPYESFLNKNTYLD